MRIWKTRNVCAQVLQGSGEVNPVQMPPSLVSGESLGVPATETVANFSNAGPLGAVADIVQPQRTEHKETLSTATLHVLASPELQPSVHHTQAEPVPPNEAQSKQGAQKAADSALGAGEGFGQAASSWRRMSQDSIPPAPGSAEALSVHAASSGTDSEDLTYAVMDDYSLAELPSQAQMVRQTSREWGGEQLGAPSSHTLAGTRLTTGRDATEKVSDDQPGLPFHDELGTPSSFTFSRHNSGAEVALSPAIFGSRQPGSSLAEARDSLHTAQSRPANRSAADDTPADDTPAAISTRHDSLVAPLRRGTTGMQFDGADQQSLQALPKASLSIEMALPRTQAEYPSKGADITAAVHDGESASSPSHNRAARPVRTGNMPAEAAMQEMRLSDDEEAHRSDVPRSRSAAVSSSTAAPAPLRAAKSGIATFGSTTGLAMGRMGLLSRSAAGQLVKNMSKATAKPNAVSIVRHSSDSAAQPAMPKQASWLKEAMRTHGVVQTGSRASHSGATAGSGLAAAPYRITSPRPTDEDLSLLLLTGEAERGQTESSGYSAKAEEELVTSRFNSAAKRYSDVDPRHIRSLSSIKAYRHSSGESTWQQAE